MTAAVRFEEIDFTFRLKQWLTMCSTPIRWSICYTLLLDHLHLLSVQLGYRFEDVLCKVGLRSSNFHPLITAAVGVYIAVIRPLIAVGGSSCGHLAS